MIYLSYIIISSSRTTACKIENCASLEIRCIFTKICACTVHSLKKMLFSGTPSQLWNAWITVHEVSCVYSALVVSVLCGFILPCVDHILLYHLLDTCRSFSVCMVDRVLPLYKCMVNHFNWCYIKWNKACIISKHLL